MPPLTPLTSWPSESWTVPAAVPLVSQTWLPWVASSAVKNSSPPIATGAERVVTVAPKLIGTAVINSLPSRSSTWSRTRLLFRPPTAIFRLRVVVAKRRRARCENIGHLLWCGECQAGHPRRDDPRPLRGESSSRAAPPVAIHPSIIDKVRPGRSDPKPGRCPAAGALRLSAPGCHPGPSRGGIRAIVMVDQVPRAIRQRPVDANSGDCDPPSARDSSRSHEPWRPSSEGRLHKASRCLERRVYIDEPARDVKSKYTRFLI